jgi:hypothetical protein
MAPMRRLGDGASELRWTSLLLGVGETRAEVAQTKVATTRWQGGGADGGARWGCSGSRL